MHEIAGIKLFTMLLNNKTPEPLSNHSPMFTSFLDSRSA
jgi:hypothetical protein